MLELIVTMVIIGILAVAALPRFFDRNTYDSRGFYDQTMAALRYAQKAAIAQRRNVCASFTTNSVTLTIASTAGSSVACNSNLQGPDGKNPYIITARTGVSYTALPKNFNFTALGQASQAQTIQVTGITSVITIVAETGYVRS